MRFIFFAIMFFVSALPAAAGQVDVTLQIPIGAREHITVCGPDGTLLSCTGIANYIAAAYRWLVGFTTIVAVLAMTWSGVLWLTSGGESGKIGEARKIMGNAIIGLVIALLSYLLLSTINPRFVQFNPLIIKPIQPIPILLDPPEVLVRTAPSTAPPTGTCCPSADVSEIIALMQRNGVNDAGGFKRKYPLMKPALFAAIKIVLEQCPEPGLVITSTVRPESSGSWHQKGGAIDFSGKICGAQPTELCDSAKARNLIAAVMAAGYGVGTFQGTCSSFRDLGTGPHMHIELPGSPY